MSRPAVELWRRLISPCVCVCAAVSGSYCFSSFVFRRLMDTFCIRKQMMPVQLSPIYLWGCRHFVDVTRAPQPEVTLAFVTDGCTFMESAHIFWCFLCSPEILICVLCWTYKSCGGAEVQWLALSVSQEEGSCVTVALFFFVCVCVCGVSMFSLCLWRFLRRFSHPGDIYVGQFLFECRTGRDGWMEATTPVFFITSWSRDV